MVQVSQTTSGYPLSRLDPLASPARPALDTPVAPGGSQPRLSGQTPSDSGVTVDELDLLMSQPGQDYGLNETSPELRLLDTNVPGRTAYANAAVATAQNQVINLDVVVVPGMNIGGGIALSNPDQYAGPGDPIAQQILIYEVTSFFERNVRNIGQSLFGRDVTQAEKDLFLSTALNAGNGYSLIGKQAKAMLALASTPAAQSRQADILKATLEVREGRRNDAYLDSEGILTVGIGHKVLPSDNISLGQVISDAQIDAFFAQDSAAALNAARAQTNSIGIISSNFIAALANANFQLGNFPATFPNAWNYIRTGQIDAAIPEITNSLWARQTPTRVNDFVEAVRDLGRLYQL